MAERRPHWITARRPSSRRRRRAGRPRSDRLRRGRRVRLSWPRANDRRCVRAEPRRTGRGRRRVRSAVSPRSTAMANLEANEAHGHGFEPAGRGRERALRQIARGAREFIAHRRPRRGPGDVDCAWPSHPGGSVARGEDVRALERARRVRRRRRQHGRLAVGVRHRARRCAHGGAAPGGAVDSARSGALEAEGRRQIGACSTARLVRLRVDLATSGGWRPCSRCRSRVEEPSSRSTTSLFDSAFPTTSIEHRGQLEVGRRFPRHPRGGRSRR